MSKKWKKIYKKDNLLLSKETIDGHGEYIFKPIKEPKHPHHLHFSQNFMRITNEKNKELSFQRLTLDENKINQFLQDIKKDKSRELNPNSISNIILLVPKNLSDKDVKKELEDETMVKLVSNYDIINGNEFVKLGYLGVSDFKTPRAKVLVNHENKIYWSTMSELININPDVNEFMKNKDKIIKDKIKKLKEN
jgi:hypothetical protein